MRLLFSFLFLCFSFFPTSANNITKVSEIPEHLIENANHVTFQEKNDYVISSPFEITSTQYLKAAILTDDSYLRNISVSYDEFTKPKSIKLTIYDSDGKKIDSYKKKDFRDVLTSASELYSNSRALTLDIEKFNTPFILEYEIVKELKGELYYDNYFAQTFRESVMHSEYNIIFPQALGIQYKMFNNAPEPTSSDVGTNRILRWSFDNLPAIKREPMGPNTREHFPYVSLIPNKFYYDGYQGSMETWEDYNKFYYELNKERDQLSDEMKALVSELTAGIADEKDKIITLYNYLKDNMRYISVQLGIGGWQTFDAAYVEKNKYGDCKALSNFMGAMLNEVNIKSNKVIIYRGQSGYRELSEDFVNTPFNHAIVYVPSQDMFLECTSNTYPAGYLGNDNAGHKVMVSTAEGPIFKTTPFMGKNENRQETNTTIKILEDGSAEIENTSTYIGGPHDGMRNNKSRYTQEEREKNFQEDFPLGIEKLEHLTIDISENEPTLTLNYKLLITKYGSKAGTRMFIPSNPIHASTFVPSKTDNRKLPFYSKSERTVENQISIIVPENYEIEALPDNNFSESTEFGDFRLSVKKEGNTIKIYKKWVKKTFVFPPDRYDDYRNKMKVFNKMDSGKIVLVKKKT